MNAEAVDQFREKIDTMSLPDVEMELTGCVRREAHAMIALQSAGALFDMTVEMTNTCHVALRAKYAEALEMQLESLQRGDQIPDRAEGALHAICESLEPGGVGDGRNDISPDASGLYDPECRTRDAVH